MGTIAALDMNDTTRRLWGIDVIAAIYALATLVLVWLCFNGTPIGRTCGLILAPVCAILCFGIAFRVNIVRVALMVVLAIGLVGDGLLMLFLVSTLVGLFDSPPNKEPFGELGRMAFRLGAALAMFLYLKRSDVRDAFRHR
jgi:hypothetical protein